MMESMREAIPAVFTDGPGAVSVERDVIRAQGPDCESFLQGQLSQDLAQIDAGGSAFSLLLHPQGKVDSWMRVSRLGDNEFLLDLDVGAGAGALVRLQRFLLRTDCTFELATWRILCVRGPGAEGLTIADLPGADVVVAAEWPGCEGIDALGPAVGIPTPLAEASLQDLETLRIISGVPSMGAELDETTIPAEAGIVERSVSFTKGCYTGQELVARIDSRGGQVPRNLSRVVTPGPAAVGAAVEVDGVAVGTLTSVAAAAGCTVGLAYVKRGTEVPCAARVAGHEATVLALVD
jgi:tRNA-modifying protein YgfZ